MKPREMDFTTPEARAVLRIIKKEAAKLELPSLEKWGWVQALMEKAYREGYERGWEEAVEDEQFGYHGDDA